MRIEEKLALDAFKTDSESHLRIKQEICNTQCVERYCIYVCPAHLYSYNADTGQMQVEYTGCLECGTCRMTCPHGALEWSYPRGGYGVRYRYG